MYKLTYPNGKTQKSPVFTGQGADPPKQRDKIPKNLKGDDFQNG